MELKTYYVWLSLCLGAGSSHAVGLLEHFGGIEGVYAADEAAYLAFGIEKSKVLTALCDKRLDDANDIIEYCRKKHVYILTIGSAGYPQSFRQISNPPIVLYTMGRLCDFDDNVCITMVGTRKCTAEGRSAAYSFGYRIAECGGIVVSGLAAGIDSASIRGALDASGFAVGIIGCGIDRIYPQSNAELYGRMYTSGVVMSEFAPYTRPLGENFPIRNRLLAALSLGTVVVEGDVNSGALITADFASDQGKKLYAVPGGIANPASEGPNYLIKTGAVPVTNAYEILDDYLYLYPHRITIKTPAAKIIVPGDLTVATPLPPHREQRRSSYRADISLEEPLTYATVNSSHKSAETASSSEKNTVRREKATLKENTVSSKGGIESILTKKKSDIPEDVRTLLSELDLKIVELAEKGIDTCDDLVRETGEDVSKVLSSMTVLEALGIFTQDAGGRLIRL